MKILAKKIISQNLTFLVFCDMDFESSEIRSWFKICKPFGFNQTLFVKQILNQVQEKVKFCDKFFCEFFYHKKAKKSSLFLKKKFGGFLPQINRGIMRL